MPSVRRPKKDPAGQPTWWKFAARFNEEILDKSGIGEFSHAVAVRCAIVDGMQTSERSGREVAVADAMVRAEHMMRYPVTPHRPADPFVPFPEAP